MCDLIVLYFKFFTKKRGEFKKKIRNIISVIFYESVKVKYFCVPRKSGWRDSDEYGFWTDGFEG